MIKRELFNFYYALMSLADVQGNFKWSYGIAKNIKLMKDEVAVFKKLLDMSEDFAKYENERIGLAKKYSEKDEKGEAIIIGQEYKIIDGKRFNAELVPLQKRYKKAIEERKNQLNELNELLKEEAETKSFYKIKLCDTPDSITPIQMAIILPLLEEET